MDAAMSRRTLCILITAGPGHVNAARSLVGRCIRRTLKVKRWGEAPHEVGYLAGFREDGATHPPRYQIEATDDEARRLLDAVERAAVDAGWRGADGALRAPIDAYHD